MLFLCEQKKGKLPSAAAGSRLFEAKLKSSGTTHNTTSLKKQRTSCIQKALDRKASSRVFLFIGQSSPERLKCSSISHVKWRDPVALATGRKLF